MSDRLPIEDVIPQLLDALRNAGRAVLQAPPGAGKTTRVPLAVLEDGMITGKILMLEPRRLAARAAATRLAQQLGERVGDTVGYRMRGDSRAGKRIEVVTEGILTRMIQSDPALSDVGLVIFDEFHERSLNADLGLALTWEVRQALRDDLRVLVMSATLDAAPVAALLQDAPIITAQGRSFPVDERWLTKPLAAAQRRDVALHDLVLRAVSETEGGVLVFLPGAGEIRRAERYLKSALPGNCVIRPLYGALDHKAQQDAIRPDQSHRKIVLATSIAETSLTIQDVRVVVDAGQARRLRFDPGSGMSRLVTERVSRAEATQRAGRAGRVAPGVAYKLWTKAEQGALPAFAPAEIEIADLTGLALELANWGSTPEDLALLTQPNTGAMAEAKALLSQLSALDENGRITPHGRALAALPLHPRIAHMLQSCGPSVANLAALLSESDLMPGRGADLGLRLRALAQPDQMPALKSQIARLRTEARRLAAMVPPQSDPVSPAVALAHAYPDRIALRRKGDAPRYVLSGGRGAEMPADDSLAGTRLLVVSDLDGAGREARIRQALPIAESELRGVFADQIEWQNRCDWDPRSRQIRARAQERFGALVLQDQIWKDPPADAVSRAMLDGVRDLGLRLPDAARRFQARVALARAGGADLPDLGDTALIETLEDWLAPHLNGVRSAEDWKRFDPTPALRAALDWQQTHQLDQDVPESFTTPLGRKIPIDYTAAHPTIEVRLQEMFGATRHPTVGANRQPLRVVLLSPAQRPIQTTMDLPGFWQGSYDDVRKDMRAQYPKHPWPEDPSVENPTLRAKRRPK